MTEHALTGFKWGTPGFGTAGGQVTWSFAATFGSFFDFDSPISEAAFQNLVRDAFAAWEKVANIDFVEVADNAQSDIRLGWDAIDGRDNFLGEAYVTWDGNNVGTHGEIRFDTAEAFTLDKSAKGAVANFYALALHEIGHIIGLDHTEDPTTIMHHYIGQAVEPSATDIAAVQHLYGLPTGAPSSPANAPYSTADMELVAATYQFFTGSVPSEAGFAFLIRSDLNANDLGDAYYSGFNQENRFINFANNLGSFGAGAEKFDAAFGDLSFEQAVALAYDQIVGTGRAAGANVDAAHAFFIEAYGFYESVALERVVPSGVALDDAVKLVMIGSMLNESVKAHAGVYADAVDDFVASYHAGAAAGYGSDLLAA